MSRPLWQLVDETVTRVESNRGWSFTCLNAKGEWKARRGRYRAVGYSPEELLREVARVNEQIKEKKDPNQLILFEAVPS